MNQSRPIYRPSVSELVGDRIKEQILDGTLKPGEKLPSENELAEMFEVSRVTVREALLRLTAVGLLESRFGSGSYVRQITPGMNMNAIIPAAYLSTKSILDVIEFRQMVEGKMAGLAAQRATEEDVEELERIYREMEQYKNDPARFAEADLNFHLKLAVITRNSLLSETMNIIRSMLNEAMFCAIQHRGHTKGIYYHRLLIDNIRAHKVQETMEIMQEHIDDVYLTMKDSLQSMDLE